MTEFLAQDLCTLLVYAVEAAEHAGVSLNMFVNVALAQTVGEAFKI